ncbi:class I adenylate-forming enzyme family protein [Dermatobacter hominis]|uniref:class I adenylate-forming enzyme family protein n=1 Tax=Dermatobacter hominis TaxID=2884263 RepID=UPI001D127C22|nr:class I adenylate-forming enzyme family protein [Dermatobacter hominis]UDY35060.1 acyl--CoA ligase [Dermatobacter hominis]
MTTFTGPDLASTPGIGALTLGAFLDEVVARSDADEALVLDDELRGGATVRWTYARLGDEARRIGRALVGAGVAPGDHVVVAMGNRPEAVAALFGASMAGAVVSPVSTFATRPELEHVLGLVPARVVLTQSRLATRRLGDDLRSLRGRPGTVAVLGEPSWDELLDRGTAVAPDDLRRRAVAATPDDPALVIFSSGTTSGPKAILHGHRAVALQFWLEAQVFGRHRATRMYCALPMFWTAGLNTAMGATLAAGGCWVMQEVFEAGAALALMARERVTEPYTLPHQTSALAEHPDWEATDLSAMTSVYGRSAFARHPSVQGDPGWIAPVGYGLSETCSSLSAHRSDTPREVARSGHGRLLPGALLRVLGTDGAALDAGQEGELAVGGATLMQRYLGAARAECLDADGFLHTGDTGHVDADGIVHYSGRRTEMIKTGGANVAPAEIEVQLRAFPPVKLSRVLGVPDDELGQVVVACVVCKDGRSTTAAEVRSFLRERVAAYKVPRRVLFLSEDEVPMTTASTKVRDDRLLAVVLDRLAADPDDGPAPAPVPRPPLETTGER